MENIREYVRHSLKPMHENEADTVADCKTADELKEVIKQIRLDIGIAKTKGDEKLIDGLREKLKQARAELAKLKEESVSEASNDFTSVKECYRAIALARKALQKKLDKGEFYENFGQDEVRSLRDRTPVYSEDINPVGIRAIQNAIEEFNEWCMNATPRHENATEEKLINYSLTRKDFDSKEYLEYFIGKAEKDLASVPDDAKPSFRKDIDTLSRWWREFGKNVHETISETYINNLARAEKLANEVFLPKLKAFAQQYNQEHKGLYGPNFSNAKVEMIDSMIQVTGYTFTDTSAGEMINASKLKTLEKIEKEVQHKVMRIVSEFCDVLMTEFNLNAMTLDDYGANKDEIFIIMSGKGLYESVEGDFAAEVATRQFGEICISLSTILKHFGENNLIGEDTRNFDAMIECMQFLKEAMIAKAERNQQGIRDAVEQARIALDKDRS